ncbi:pre-RNA processing PIH1/Nop17-domain-containing protein [Crassisporium funariophilum]|nr:pre-RNA processing PIH1/Nop17-domain-containing protein [Crassisporium funariophilum]
MSSSTSSTHTRIDLAPKPGFCIKTSTLTPAVLPSPPPTPTPNPHLLEPPAGPIVVPKGLKVFVNIAWDARVPPPPEGSEDAVQRAMRGEEVDGRNAEGWYVPVIVSNGRHEKDKAGNPSLVFDCIYNTTIKSRTLYDPEFKIFLVELALQRIEAQTSLTLSREIATPNITSKGKLLPRTVHLPKAMMTALTAPPPPPPPATGTANANAKAPGLIDLSADAANLGKAPLIQEITPAESSVLPASKSNGAPQTATSAVANGKSKTPGASNSLPGLRGILKSSGGSTSSKKQTPTTDPAYSPSSSIKINPNAPLDWTYTKDESGRLRLEIHVPNLSQALVQGSTLDIEPRRLLLSIPHRRPLDIDLSLSDAEIVSRIAGSNASAAADTTTTAPSPPSSTRKEPEALALQKQLEDEERTKRKEEETARTLKLKRLRDFDVDGAAAEWMVGSGVVVVHL